MRSANNASVTFQFLIGILKTAPGRSFCTTLFRVSIPHRYPKNLSHYITPSLLTLFQFLIGILKTTLRLPYYRHLPKFQFLIGILKTEQGVEQNSTNLNVSIPHRYPKNDGLCRSRACRDNSFNSS